MVEGSNPSGGTMEIVAVEQVQDEKAIPNTQSMTVKKGSVIHVKVGGEFSDGQPPFVPTQEDLRNVRDNMERAFPNNKVIVTHQFVDIYVVHIDDDEI